MRRKKLNGSQPNDIAFLLILFFLLLIISSIEYSLDLSTSGNQAEEKTEEIFNLNLTSNGLFVENLKIDEATLYSQLKVGQKVNLTVEENVLWQDVIATLSLLNQKEIVVNLEQKL